MAPNSRYPAFVVVQYHSPFGIHNKSLCTLEWNPGGGASGQFNTHNSGVVDAEDMIVDLLTLEAEFMPTTVNYDGYTIFTMDTPTSDPVPRYAADISIPGTVAVPGWYKAAQATWTFRTSLFGIAKVVQLDVATLNSFEKILSGTVSADQIAFIAQYTNPDEGWAGRDGGRPATFVQLAFDLNDKLRAEYGLN